MESLEPTQVSASAGPEVGGNEIETRSRDELRVCSNCQASNARGDDFCIACGAPLASSDHEATPGELVGATSEDHPPSSGSGRYIASWKVAVAGVLLAAALAGLAAFATLWQLESSKSHRLRDQLATTRSGLDATKSALAATRAQLDSTNALSNKRRAVLLQAQDILGKVDPLLSSVDNVQSKAGGLASQGTAVSGDSEAIIATVAGLVNYLIRSNGGYVDFAWVNQEIASANSEIDALRYDESVFSTDDESYTGASTAFVTKANSFSSSIRVLERQLKSVTSK